MIRFINSSHQVADKDDSRCEGERLLWRDLQMKFHILHNGSGRNRGFTLIEMAIVCVLIGILAAMAVPLFTRTIPRIKCRAEARNILNTIRVARSRAIGENIQYGVYFDSNAKLYELFKDKVNPSLMTFEAGDSVVGAPINVDPNVVYNGIAFANNCIIMLPTGAASQSGSVGVNTTSGDAPFTISVLAATGKSKLQ
jgi:prepilin-type N-terminal cleavage/methylation domain-containing protein